MKNTAIKADQICYSYGETLAVKGISFEVARGEIVGFLGPNGAGKSTTIKMLTGQIAPKTGKVMILGMDITREDSRIQGRIGVCFEEKNLYLNMTGIENLAFFAALFGLEKDGVPSLLDRVGLGSRGGDRVKQYSKGMQQRLMVARSLVNHPEILFLDEPTEGLDPVSSRTIRNIIREEAEKGTTVLLTTHNMHEAEELCHRVIFLNEGRIHAHDSPENLNLQFGERSVRVRVREDGSVREFVIPLDRKETGLALQKAVAMEGLISIHTQEATLEDIFVRITGRGLEA